MKTIPRGMFWIPSLTVICLWMLLEVLAWGLGPPAPQWVMGSIYVLFSPGLAATWLLGSFGSGLFVLVISILFYTIVTVLTFVLVRLGVTGLRHRDAA